MGNRRSDAYELSNLILKNVRKGLALDLALQKAQRSWISAGDKDRQLPSSWAGIVLTGRSEKLFSSTREGGRYLFYGLCASICVLEVCRLLIKMKQTRSR